MKNDLTPIGRSVHEEVAEVIASAYLQRLDSIDLEKSASSFPTLADVCSARASAIDLLLQRKAAVVGAHRLATRLQVVEGLAHDLIQQKLCQHDLLRRKLAEIRRIQRRALRAELDQWRDLPST